MNPLVLLALLLAQAPPAPAQPVPEPPPAPAAAPPAPAPAPPGAIPAEGGTVHLVDKGFAWKDLAKSAKPGDQIQLALGIHMGARLEDMHGTRERPIVIRGSDATKPSAIACEEYGIELIRCSWVRVENIYFINPTKAAILIDGTPAEGSADASAMDVSIAISGVKVATSREMPGMDAIRIRNARNVGIVASRFESWSHAGVFITGGGAIVITKCMFSPVNNWPVQYGVSVAGGADFVGIVQNSFDSMIETGVQAGLCIEDTTPSPASNVQVERCAFVDIGCPVEFGPGRGGTLERCTVSEPSTAFRVDARCGEVSARVAMNIFQWTPGHLLAPTEKRGEPEARNITLGANLWWSEELPSVFDLLGRPLGSETAAQILDVNPKFNDKTFAPRTPAAERFGWLSPAESPLAPVPPATDPPAAPATDSPAAPASEPAATPPTPPTPPASQKPPPPGP